MTGETLNGYCTPLRLAAVVGVKPRVKPEWKRSGSQHEDGAVTREAAGEFMFVLQGPTLSHLRHLAREARRSDCTQAVG